MDSLKHPHRRRQLKAKENPRILSIYSIGNLLSLRNRYNEKSIFKHL